MYRFTTTVANDEGQPIEGTTVGIYTTGSSVLAVIYDDDESTPITNPLTTDDNGFVEAMLANGKYDIQVVKGDEVLSVTQIVAYDPNDGGSGSSFSDADFEVKDDGDATKKVKLQVGGLTTATTRTLSVQDADGTIALTSDLPGSASTVAAGTVELATSAEVRTGTDATLAISPDALKSALGISQYYESSQQSFSNGSLITLAHGFGTKPKMMWIHFVCVSNDATSGYSSGDEVYIDGAAGNNASSGYQAYFDTTNVYIRIGSAWNGYFQRKSDGAQTGVSNIANWRLVMRAVA